MLTDSQAKAQFKRRSTANNVQISIPVPEDADTPKFRTNIGSVHYAPETSSIVWKIKQFGGGKEFLMRAELGLPSVRGDDEKGGGMMGGFGGSMGGVGAGGKAKRPIGVKFEIPYFTTSGIQVRYLKIIEPKVCLHYKPNSANKTLIVPSCNTHLCHGCDTSPRVVTSRYVCQMCSDGIDELATTTCRKIWLVMFVEHGDGVSAHRRQFSEYLREHDDITPDVVITETRSSTVHMINSLSY
jgi:hypothetical protein